MQRKMDVCPNGCSPLYTRADWNAYQKRFGARAKNIFRTTLAGRFTFAQAMLNAASAMPPGRGLTRLLLMRAFALTFRYRGGTDLARKVLQRYFAIADLQRPTQVGALWAMADGMAWQAATPEPLRIWCDRLAEQADMQLAIELMDRGQVNAAITMVRLMPRHAALAIRTDPVLFGEMQRVTHAAFEDRVMMRYLAGQYRLMRRGRKSAALPLYLYYRFVRPKRSFARSLARWQREAIPGQLETILRSARDNPDDLYAAGRLLVTAARLAPSGVIRGRTMYAAAADLRQYIHSPATIHHRIKRTLARLMLQKIWASAAGPNSDIKPFALTWANNPLLPPAKPNATASLRQAAARGFKTASKGSARAT